MILAHILENHLGFHVDFRLLLSHHRRQCEIIYRHPYGTIHASCPVFGWTSRFFYLSLLANFLECPVFTFLESMYITQKIQVSREVTITI